MINNKDDNDTFDFGLYLYLRGLPLEWYFVFVAR